MLYMRGKWRRQAAAQRRHLLAHLEEIARLKHRQTVSATLASGDGSDGVAKAAAKARP